jgi:hypothetical protein
LFPFKSYAEAVYVDNNAEMGGIDFVCILIAADPKTAFTFRSGKEMFSWVKDYV